MTGKQLFSKTLPFVWAKLALGGAVVLLSAVLLALLLALGWLFGEAGMAVMFCIWAVLVGVLYFALIHYGGYLLKAGHVAVVAEACTTGWVSTNQVHRGKELVLQRFATSNLYFAVDKLVAGAIRQIQSGIGKVSGSLDFIPGMGAIAGVARFFVSISLGYVDECCLGWTFYCSQQGACKSAADGVVIYVQNWKPLLKDAAKTMGKVILGVVILALVIFIPIGLLFKLLHIGGLFAFALSCLVAWVVKFAVMDSYIMTQMMAAYMAVAPQTQVAFDLYSKLASVSGNFKELWNKGQVEAPAAAAAGGGAVFCGQCGTKNESGTRFCGSCGAKL